MSIQEESYPTPKEAFKAYGHAAKWEDQVAHRKTDNWYAVLFKEGDEFYAVDFQWTGYGWWLSNDYVGPFESVQEFKTERLTKTLM